MTSSDIDGPAKIPDSSRADGHQRYDRASIIFHWLTAGLVLVLFVTAQAWGFLDRADRGPLKVTHTSLGVLLTAIIVARLMWRIFFGRALARANIGWLHIAAKATHGSLYLLLLVQMALGFLAAWSGRRASVNFFGLGIPSPFEPFTRGQHHQLEGIHGWVGWTIILLAMGHAVAALFHHYVLRDNLMARMWTKPA